MNTVKSIDLTMYILARLGKASQLKLQKLVYYVESWHLAYFEKPILKEDFEAWVHGPVLRSVWSYFKERNIVSLYNDVVLKEDSKEPLIQRIEGLLSKDQKELIDNVLDEYGDKTAFYLENLTHSERPWIEARGNCDQSDRCDTPISKETMKKFYQDMIA